MEYGEGKSKQNDKWDEGICVIALHELDYSPSSICPRYRGGGPANEARREHSLKAHASDQAQHGTYEHSARHERNPDEDYQTPESVSVYP